MAGKRIVIPNYMPALDLNGNPLAGAKITFYENETTTLASVYANEALTTPLANPVVADLAGVFPSIFADEDLVFTVAINDANDNPIGGLRNKDEVRPSQIFGADSAAAENANAAAQTALSQILDLASGAPDAPSILNKLNKDGDNADAGLLANIGAVASADLADDTGAGLVGVIASGAGAVARTQQAKNRDVVSVKDFGAVGDGVTNDLASIQAALTEIAALTYGGEVNVPSGSYVLGGATLTIPTNVTLVMADGARLVSSAANAITVTIGNDGASGGIRGAGVTSIISHTGSGFGVYAVGTFSQADLKLADFRVQGTSSGQAGVHLEGFNMASLWNVKVSGYSAGDGFRSTGANGVAGYNCEFTSNLNGIRLLTKAGPFTSNAIHFFGGQLRANTGWGWWEDTTGGGGRNLNNGPVGMVFEANGTNASATTGDIWNNNCDAFVVDKCYFENGAGIVPTNCITIGDVSGGPKGTVIQSNLFTNVSTNTINDVNGQSVFVMNNTQNGGNANFLLHGAGARGLLLYNNRVASTNYFAGADNGADSVVYGGTGGVTVNQYGPSPRGMAFNTITGSNGTLSILGPSGGANLALFKDSSSTTQAVVGPNGSFNTNGDYSVSGVKVVGARGAAVADATDAASAITQLNALLARMRAHGLIAT